MSKNFIAALWSCAALLLAPSAHAQTGGSPIPPPWQWTDIGAVGTPGDVHVGANNDWFVSGAGSDIWGAADSFHFAFQSLNGDGQIVARVVSLQNTSANAKAGLMFRSSQSPSAAHVIIDAQPGGSIERTIATHIDVVPLSMPIVRRQHAARPKYMDQKE